MRITLTRLILTCAISAILGSCSVYQDHQASEPANILEMEARMVRAGFRRVPIETPEQNGAVAQLPLHRLNRYQSATGSVYWYADPTVCSCLYEGNQQDYERYADLLEHEHDIADYMNEEPQEQVANLSPFGYAFPPPLLLGGWPVAGHGSGPILIPHGPISTSGNGGGVSPHSGSGTGITSHGHSGGHSIGHAGGHR